MRCCLTFDKNDCVQCTRIVVAIVIAHAPQSNIYNLHLEFHGDVITISTAGIPSTLNWQRPLLNLVEIIVQIFSFFVLFLSLVRQTGKFGSAFGLFGVTTIVGIVLPACFNNEPVRVRERENTCRHLEIESTGKIDHFNYQFRRRFHFLHSSFVDDTETAMIMVMVANLYKEKRKNKIEINLPWNGCESMALLTLLFVWQHVALMQPSSVVGQSNAQPSCDPFAFKLFDIPSAQKSTRIKSLGNFFRILMPHLKYYSNSRAPRTLAGWSSNECLHCGKILLLFPQFSCIRKDFCIECVPMQ